jgi:hypothetical protein
MPTSLTPRPASSQSTRATGSDQPGRASIEFKDTATSIVSKTPTAPEAQLLLEMKTLGGQQDEESWPIDQWQNTVVATGMRAHRAGFVRLRVLNINNLDGTGVAMALQVSRTGDSGAG